MDSDLTILGGHSTYCIPSHHVAYLTQRIKSDLPGCHYSYMTLACTEYNEMLFGVLPLCFISHSVAAKLPNATHAQQSPLFYKQCGQEAASTEPATRSKALYALITPLPRPCCTTEHPCISRSRNLPSAEGQGCRGSFPYFARERKKKQRSSSSNSSR
jgi:hypothetical protein